MSNADIGSQAGEMKSLTQITRWVHIVVATLAVWSQDHVESVFKQLSIGQYYLLGTLVLAVVGMQVADQIVITTIEQVRWIRRLLAGDNDIEGDWVNIVVDTASPKKIIAAEYCRIRYSGGQYVLSGDTWTLDGRWIHDFTTGGSTYQDRQLEYFYKTGINRVGGFGVIIFTPHDSLPQDFICRYVDESTKSPHATRGRRVSTDLRKVSQDERRSAALNFAEGFESRGLLDFDAAFAHYNGRG